MPEHVSLTLTQPAFDAFARQAQQSRPRPLYAPLGLGWLVDRVDLLAHRVRLAPPREDERPWLQVSFAADQQGLAAALVVAPAAPVQARLVLGTGAANGHWAGWFDAARGRRSFRELRIMGPGLLAATSTPALPVDPASADVWQRTIGALGLDVWRRLTDLSILVVGAGRNGSTMAQELAQLGLRQLALLDPDQIEVGNLGEMRALGLEHVGAPKVEAVASTLSSPVGGTQIAARPYDLAALEGLIAIKRADLVVGCVDNDRAREALAVATLYNRPLLDIGTGVLAGDGERRWGVDVRLVLPGDGCLRCFGNDHTEAPPRAGSLRSLNQVAVGLGVRMLEELALGTISGGRWVRVEYGTDGDPTLTVVAPRRRYDCPVCGLTAAGDAGLARWLEAE